MPQGAIISFVKAMEVVYFFFADEFLIAVQCNRMYGRVSIREHRT